jgi:hypothetical protein
MTLRGDVNAILNRLAREGVIDAFQASAARSLTRSTGSRNR